MMMHGGDDDEQACPGGMWTMERDSWLLALAPHRYS